MLPSSFGSCTFLLLKLPLPHLFTLPTLLYSSVLVTTALDLSQIFELTSNNDQGQNTATMSLTSFSPLSALAIAPLVSSTCTLWYAFDQHHFLSILTTHPDDKFEDVIPDYFRRFFAAGLPRVLGLLGTTCLSVAGNYVYRYDSLLVNRSLKWYLAGAALAVSHLSFTPLVLPHIQRLQRRGWPFRIATYVLSEWLYWHNFRTYTVDLAAWLCFAVAVGLNVAA